MSRSYSVRVRHSIASVVVVILACLAHQSEAKTLYVDGARGNDATTYAANSSSTPWRTIGRAAWGSANRNSPNKDEAAKAGDTVRIAAGTYVTTGTNYRFGPAYNPVNSGEAGRPIRFEGDGPVILTFSSGAGPMVGADTRNHIEWSGFTISEKSAPSVSDTGQVVFLAAVGGAIENSVLTGNANSSARNGDNYSGVRVHGSRGIRIVNNLITDYGGQSGDENHNGIETYFAGDLLVEHNEISNCGVGIYLKANFPTTGQQDIRFNVIQQNAQYGIQHFRSPYSAATRLLISQNIVRNNRLAGVRVHGFGSGAVTDEPQHAKIVNNTFVNNGEGGFSTGSAGAPPVANAGHVFVNNIVAQKGGVAVVFEHAQSHLAKTKYDFGRNVYSGFSMFGSLSGDDVDFGAWRKAGQDVDSLTLNALFVNESSGDYRLRTGTAALKVGRASHGVGGDDGLTIPAGAYITGAEVIGRRSR
jgi:Right handed beta helix region